MYKRASTSTGPPQPSQVRNSFPCSHQSTVAKISCNLNLSTVSVEEAHHASGLARGELLVAGVDGVVHVVVDGVKARNARARVTASGASRRRAVLSRSVVNLVTGAVAAALEGVEETHPVADFVGGGTALVVGSGRAARDGASEDGATIADESAAAGGSVGREVAVTQVRAQIAEEVKVERGVVTLAELTLHGHLIAVASPLGVERSVGILEREREAAVGIGAVEDLHLLSNGAVLLEEKGQYCSGAAAKILNVLFCITYTDVLRLGGNDNVDVGVDVDAGSGVKRVRDGLSLGKSLVSRNHVFSRLGSTAAELLKVAVAERNGHGSRCHGKKGSLDSHCRDDGRTEAGAEGKLQKMGDLRLFDLKLADGLSR